METLKNTMCCVFRPLKHFMPYSYSESALGAVIRAGYERMVGSRRRLPERPTHLYRNS